MKYPYVVTFVKRTNLTEYAKHCSNEALAEHYAKERDVTLNVFYRFEQDFNGSVHVICKIKCPINPLPVKGEFETPSMSVLERFLVGAGWKKHNILCLRDAE